jgi:hypothetical protein
MPTPDQLTRIHERLDETLEKLSRLTSAVETNNELCKQCRPKVLGNGREGFDTRLARVEEAMIPKGSERLTMLETQYTMSKTFLAMTITGAGAVGSIVSAIVRYFAG